MEQRDPLFRSRPCSIIRVGNWKLHQYFEDGGLELYHLGDDLGETTNRAETDPKKTKELLEQLEQWRKALNAPIPTQVNPAYDPVVEAKAIQAAKERRKSSLNSN